MNKYKEQIKNREPDFEMNKNKEKKKLRMDKKGTYETENLVFHFLQAKVYALSISIFFLTNSM